MRFLLALIVLGGVTLYSLDFELQWRHPQPLGEINWTKLFSIGCRKLIIPVFNTDRDSGGLFFFNSFTPLLKPDISSRIKTARQNKIELWAWMITRNFYFLQRTDFFDSALVNGELQKIPRLDLANEEVLRFLEELFALLARSGVDGILIQDDLIYRSKEGFSPLARKLFQLQTGIELDSLRIDQTPEFIRRKWQRFKQNLVLNALSRIVAACRKANPKIKIGLNIYYETPLWSEKSESWYAHNFKELAASGVDFLYLMAYHRQIASELKADSQRIAEIFTRLINQAFKETGKRLVVKLQFRDFDTKERLSAEELYSFLKLFPSGVERVALMSVENDDLDEVARLIAISSKSTGRD